MNFHLMVLWCNEEDLWKKKKVWGWCYEKTYGGRRRLMVVWVKQTYGVMREEDL